MKAVLKAVLILVSMMLAQSVHFVAEAQVGIKTQPKAVEKGVFSIGTTLEYLEDTTRGLQLETVKQMLYGWKQGNKTTYNMGLSRSAHWFRGTIALKDVDTAIKKWTLVVGEFGFDSAQCFIVKNGIKTAQMEVGTKILPSPECLTSKHFIAFPIDFTHDSTVQFYLRGVAVEV